MTDTSLYIYICVKHFGMANIKIKTSHVACRKLVLASTSSFCIVTYQTNYYIILYYIILYYIILYYIILYYIILYYIAYTYVFKIQHLIVNKTYCHLENHWERS